MANEERLAYGRAVAEMDYDAECAWVYEQRLRYRSVRQISELANRPAIRNERGLFSPDGGLGKPLGRTAIHNRIKTVMAEHHDELTDLASTYRAASLDRLDEMAVTLVDQINRMGPRIAQAAALSTIDVHAEDRITKATLAILRVEERRAKLLGLDSPIEVEVDVTHYDGAALELAQILDEATGGALAPKGRPKAKA